MSEEAREFMAGVLRTLEEAFPDQTTHNLIGVCAGLVSGGNTLLGAPEERLGEAYRLAVAVTGVVSDAKTITLTPTMVHGREPGDVIPLDATFLILHNVSRFDGAFIEALDEPLGGGPDEERRVRRDGDLLVLPTLLAVYAVLDIEDDDRADLSAISSLFGVGVLL